MSKTFDAYTLKIIAIIGMILQHGAMILEDVIPYALQVPMHLAGGLTFPILAFFLIEGFKHTSNVKKYILRILIFAVISQIPYVIAYGTPWFAPLNIMFLLSMGLLMVHLHENMKSRGGFWFLFAIFLLISFMIEWGIIGILMIFMYKVIKDEKKRTFWPSMMAAIFNGVLGLLAMAGVAMINTMSDYMLNKPEMAELSELMESITVGKMALVVFFGIGNILAIYFIKRYNGERGKSLKYLFYVIYPLHFAVLALIAHALGIAG